MESKKPKVLMTFIESGMGHIMSMRAVTDGLKKLYSEEMDIIETEIMRDTNSPEQIWFENFLTTQTKMTNKVKSFGPFIFKILDIGKQPFMKFVHHTLFKKATNATVEALKTHNPDVIVSTHYFITFCAIEYKLRHNPNVIVVTYDPDNNVHAWWDNRGDIFITNNNLATDEAVNRRNFNRDSVKQVFFTARECVVNAIEDKELYREKYGIPKDKFAVLFADGAYADGKAKKFADYLLKTEKPVTVMVLAGKNKKVYQYFKDKQSTMPPNITLIPYEFTPEAYELYCASDLFVTKGGPNAVLDCLFMSTPVMIDYFPHPIEKATYKLFVESLGCGVGAFDKKTARKMIENYIDNPTLLDEYRNNIKKHIDRNQNGAEQVGKIIKEAIENHNPTRENQKDE